MANDKNRKMNNDGKNNNNSKRNSSPPSCKPCIPIERNGNNSKDRNGTTKNPSSSYSTNTSSCYAKCKTQYIQQAPPKNEDEKEKDLSKANSSKSDAKWVTEGCEIKPLRVTNPYIETMEEDILYHIALGNKSHDLPKMFGDVKFVVMGGTPKRMEQFAYFIANQIGYELQAGTVLNDISKNSHRYAMFKVGPVLSVSHGMGTPSIGILLHELIKLMFHAGVKHPIFVRIGTCGGFSKTAGTVVVSNKVVNDFMEPFCELVVLGKKVRFPAHLNQGIVKEIVACSESEDKFETIAGVTYCTNNFYEGSGRADGAICEFSEQDAMNYYKELQKNGVVNVEMESLAFAALTCRAGIESAVIAVILSDRLETDQIKQPKEVLDEWQTRPQKLLAKYIKKKIPDGSAPITSSTTSRSWTTTDVTSGTSSSNAYSVCKPCTGADINASGGVDTDGTVKTSEGTTSKPITTLPTTTGTGFSDATKSLGGMTCKPASGVPTTTGSALNDATKPTNRFTCKPTASVPTTTGSALSDTTNPTNGMTCKPATCVPTTTGSTLSDPTNPTNGMTCKPATSVSTTIDSASSDTIKPTNRITCKPAASVPTTTGSALSYPANSVSGMTCKPATSVSTTAASALSDTTKSANGTTSKPFTNESSVCKPCVLGSTNTSKTVTDASAKTTTQTTAKSSIGANENSSGCKPCTGTGQFATTYEKTACKASDGVTSEPTSTAENGNVTEQKISKCVPVKCYSSEKVDTTTPMPTTPKTYLAKDFDSSSKSTISNDSWRSCYQKCSKQPASNSGTTLPQAGSTSTTTFKPNAFQTPEQDKMKGFSTDQLGPCCSLKAQPKEVEDVEGPCCSGKSDESSSSDECTGGEENHLEEIEYKKEESNNENNNLATKRRKSFSKLNESRPNSDNQLGPCCPGQRKEVTMQPVDSKALGPYCSGNSDEDSPEETCDDRVDRSQAITDGQKTNEAAAPKQSNAQGCPLTIRTPCPYFGGSSSSSDPQMQTTPSVKLDITSTTSNLKYSTPKPSPDTPDTSTTRAMPAFITPTPPLSKASICCSKFSGSNTATVHFFINKEANKYDESPSPCAACKKYQESKNKSSGSTPSDSQPEIIKCLHKLKRLKEECQGYD